MNFVNAVEQLNANQSGAKTFICSSDLSEAKGSTSIFYVYQMEYSPKEKKPFKLVDCHGLIPSDEVQTEVCSFTTAEEMVSYVRSSDAYIMSLDFFKLPNRINLFQTISDIRSEIMSSAVEAA